MGSLLTAGTLKVAKWPIFLEATREGHCGVLMRGRGHDLSWAKLCIPPFGAAIVKAGSDRSETRVTVWT